MHTTFSYSQNFKLIFVIIIIGVQRVCIKRWHFALNNAMLRDCPLMILGSRPLFWLAALQRLDKELRLLLPPSISSGIRVIPPPYGADSAWYGAKLLSNLSTFPSSWCIDKKDFRPKSKRNFFW
ncbi:putative Actin family, ATPase, nucleotide binding domain-containing protein [Helianthus annuus]|nr:putative Actin family, ATPase, nucleotide binding domain-containing protein [Helianthus annuus]